MDDIRCMYRNCHYSCTCFSFPEAIVLIQFFIYFKYSDQYGCEFFSDFRNAVLGIVAVFLLLIYKNQGPAWTICHSLPSLSESRRHVSKRKKYGYQWRDFHGK
jgi:hypothetical protein